MNHQDQPELIPDAPDRTLNERRQFQRFEVDASARVEILGPTNRKRALFLKTSNISAEGAYFPTKRALALQLPVKMDIFLNLDLNNGKVLDRRIHILSVTGEVARVDRRGMAVKFKRDYELNPIDMRMFAKN